VGILTLAALVGLRFLTAGMAALNRHNAVRSAFAQAAADAAPDEAPSDTPEEPSAEPGSEPEPVTVGAPATARKRAKAVPGKAVVLARASGNGALVAYPSMAPASQRAARPVTAGASTNMANGAEERQASMTLLYVWILLFGFVGTQLAWTLRPFFGSPGEKFEIFRSIDGNFYVDIVRTLGHLF
jgi:hypothetical protein